MAQNEQGGRDTQTQQARQQNRSLAPRSGTAAGNTPRPAGAQLSAPSPDTLSQQLAGLTSSIRGLSQSFQTAANKKQMEENRAKAAKNERKMEIQNLADTQAQLMVQKATLDPSTSPFFNSKPDEMMALTSTALRDDVGTEYDSDFVAYANDAGYELDDEDLVNYRRRIFQRSAPELAEIEGVRYRTEVKNRMDNYKQNFLDVHDDATVITPEVMKEAEETLGVYMTDLGLTPAQQQAELREFRKAAEVQVLNTNIGIIQHTLAVAEYESSAFATIFNELDKFSFPNDNARRELEVKLLDGKFRALDKEEAETRQSEADARRIASEQRETWNRVERILTEETNANREAVLDAFEEASTIRNARVEAAIINGDFGIVGETVDVIWEEAQKYAESDPPLYRNLMAQYDDVVRKATAMGSGYAAAWEFAFVLDPEAAMGRRDNTVAALQSVINSLPRTHTAELQRQLTRIMATEAPTEGGRGTTIINQASEDLMSTDPNVKAGALSTFSQILKGGLENVGLQAHAMYTLFDAMYQSKSPEEFSTAVTNARLLLTDRVSTPQTVYPVLQFLDAVQGFTSDKRFFYSAFGVGAAHGDTTLFGLAPDEESGQPEQPGTVDNYSRFLSAASNFNATNSKNFFDIVREGTLEQYQVTGWNYNNVVRFIGNFIPGDRNLRNAGDRITFGNVSNDALFVTEDFSFTLEGFVNAELMRMQLAGEVDISSATSSKVKDMVTKARRNVEDRLRPNTYQYRLPNDTYAVGYIGPEHPPLNRQILGAGANQWDENPYGDTNESPGLRAARETMTTMAILQSRLQEQGGGVRLTSKQIAPTFGLGTALPRIIARGSTVGASQGDQSLNTTDPSRVAQFIQGSRPSVFGDFRVARTTVNPFNTQPLPNKWSADEWAFQVGGQELVYDIGAMRETEVYKAFMEQDKKRTDYQFITFVNSQLNQDVADHLFNPETPLQPFRSLSEYLNSKDPQELLSRKTRGYEFEEIWIWD